MRCRRITVFLLSLTIAFFTLITSVTSSHADTRGIKLEIKTPEGRTIELYHGAYALVIGNGSYKNGWDPLPGAIEDVAEVAEALKKYGFKVTLKRNLTKEAFSQVLSEFSINYGRNKDNQLLIYYAGHGYTQKMATGEDLGYLVMVDAPLPEKDPLGFSTKAVDMQAIITQAKLIMARHVLFMFDSCFSGTLLSLREKVVPKNISESVKYPVRQFITAGRANEPVPDRSVFKQAFLNLLAGSAPEPIPDGYITGEELGLYLKNKVPEYNPAQHPQYGKIRDPNLDQGDFVFVSSNTANYWRSKQKTMETELKRLEAGTKQAETKAKELQAKQKAEKLAGRIAEAKRKKEAAEKRVRKLAMAKKPGLNRIDQKSLTNSIGMKFVYISPGSFMMGSPTNESGRVNDEKRHRVILTQGFYLQTTEVTQGQWRRVMGDNPSYFKRCGDDCPVERVSWNEVQEFISKLNQLEGINKYRLPTEVEWEYACRAGSSRRFSYGDDAGRLKEYAWYDSNSGGEPHPVGQKKPNAWGLYDMHGNVWEWVQDWYRKEYPLGSVTNPQGPSGGSKRVLRGGSLLSLPRFVRCAFRYKDFPEYRSIFWGFRCLRSK